HPRVGTPEVPEVEVPRVLTAEDCTGFGHGGLDVGVTDAAPDRFSAVLLDNLGYGARRDQIVNDSRTRFLPQFTGRDQRGQYRRGDNASLLVYDETAIRVTVEGESEVSL